MIDITISAHPDRGDLKEQIESAMEALGFTRTAIRRQAELLSGTDQAISHVSSVASTTDAVDDGAKPKTRRGRQARGATSEETAAPVIVDANGDTVKNVLDEPSVQQAISTGEERIGPDDSPEVEAQDRADEAAEMAAAKPTETVEKVTHNDIRMILGRYQQAFGKAVMEDGPKIIAGVLGAPPAGEDFWKISFIPDDQEKLRRIYEACDEAIAKNPYGREAA